MSFENIQEGLKNSSDYSYIRVLLRHWKKRILKFSAGLIKNSKRISWNKKKNLFKEFLCVLAIVTFLAIYFYLIFFIIVLIN